MATYEEKKRIAIGLVAEPADPFAVSSIFSVPKKEVLEASEHISFYEKALKEQTDRQLSLKAGLAFWDEYEKDRKQAAKNYNELKGYLQLNDPAKIERLLSLKPAAEWLNQVFLESTELDDVMNLIKNITSDCKTIITDAIRKELNSLVNFKALLELILIDLTL